MDLETVRKERYSWEKNDCTVVALAVAAKMSYKEVWGKMAVTGRANGMGIVFDLWARKEERKFNGFYLVQYCYTGFTVQDFVRREPSGRFIVTVRISKKAGHALAVVDGQILDLVKTNPSAVIKSVWKLVNWKLEG